MHRSFQGVVITGSFEPSAVDDGHCASEIVSPGTQGDTQVTRVVGLPEAPEKRVLYRAGLLLAPATP